MPDGIQISVTEPTQIAATSSTDVNPTGAPQGGPTYSGVKPSPSIDSTSDDHSRALRRIFIGFMPAAHAQPAVENARGRFWFGSNRPLSSASGISGVSAEEERKTLRQLFMNRGGRNDQWEGEDGRKFRKRWGFFGGEEQYAPDLKGKGQAAKREWVGRTFEVGAEFWELRGNAALPSLRVEPGPSDNALSLIDQSKDFPDDAVPPSRPPLVTSPSSAADMGSYVTARTNQLEVPPRAASPSFNLDPSGSPGSLPLDRPSISSTRPLISVPPPGSVHAVDQSDGPQDSDHLPRLQGLRSALRSRLDRPRDKADGKLKGRTVQFPNLVEGRDRRRDDASRSQIDGAQEPAPPGDVLARTGSDIGGTSAGASVIAQQEDDGPEAERDVVMRDRMLLRAFYTRSEDLPNLYDEEEARRHPDAHGEDWAEHLVVWRGGAKRRVEVYEDYGLPGQAYFVGHKRLAFVIPLASRSTHLSLYSAADFTFCITCSPTPTETWEGKGRSLFHLSKTGTNIFVFKTKCRSRAVDWMWKLWRDLGGKVPSHLDVNCPALDTRVRVSVPALDALSLTRETVISSCLESLSHVPDWNVHLERALRQGAKAELCWRKGMKLDWVWLGTDVDGRQRPWEVLGFLALRQARNPSSLEIRLAQHHPTKATLSDGSSLSEPPAIEGYLHRITPASSRLNDGRRRVYLSTHDGNIMFIQFGRAHPPVPPVIPPTGQTDEQQLAAWAAFRVAETERQGDLVLEAEEFLDFRQILAVRWASEPKVARQEDVSNESGNIPELHDGWEAEMVRDAERGAELEHEDPDAENGAPRTYKLGLRLKRSFELLLRSGHVLRFEARTRKHASEWIYHLKALTSYWTRQQRVWARFEMDVTYGVDGEGNSEGPARPRQPTGWYPRPKEPADPDAGSPLLGQYWHWCVLDGCRAITKAGRLYQKVGYRKQFTQMYHVLVQGHLMQFRLATTAAITYRHVKTIPLAHAYIYSGQLAIMSLPRTQDDTHGRVVTRYYQDGLEANDSDEDTTFIIWYRDMETKITPVAAPPASTSAAGHSQTGETPSSRKLPPLGADNQLLILRARSRLERDAWCWALNAQIEKVVRASRGRERKLREEGGVIA